MVSRLLPALAAAAAALLPAQQFRARSIATDLKSGYQVVVHDVNRDGKPDLIGLASGLPDLHWFENPTWERRVLARGLNRMINLGACPGVEELMVAHEFANVPKNSIGIVSILTPGPDRRQPWSAREIDRITTAHRLRCADPQGNGQRVFINAPLAGAKADAPDYRDRIPLVYYKPGEWKRHTIGHENEGVMHGIYIFPWEKRGRDSVLTASFVGLHSYSASGNGQWRRQEIAKGDPAPWPKNGASDLAVGHLKKQRYVASIEPWHGHQVAIYTRQGKSWARQVIDSEFEQGHTIVTGDLNADGREEVVAGFRGARRGAYIYSAAGKDWKRTTLDDKIAASACAIADLNQDKRPDVACIGSATANLVLYENLGR